MRTTHRPEGIIILALLALILGILGIQVWLQMLTGNSFLGAGKADPDAGCSSGG